MKNGFWGLGTAPVEVSRKNTLLEEAGKIQNEEESDDGNFDLVLETAENIDILRPILRHQVSVPTISEMEKHCAHVLKQTLYTFTPDKSIVAQETPSKM